MKLKVVKAVLFVFVLVVLGYAVWMAYSDIMKYMPKRKNDTEPYTNGDDAKLKICLYKATWCHFCTDYLKSGVFEDTYADVKGKYNDVAFVTYDFDENKKLAEKYGIESFPSIIAVDANGKLLGNFEGDRMKKEDLVKFVEDNRVKL
jgi:thiol-disulfide isomerase/thioredoxin